LRGPCLSHLRRAHRGNLAVPGRPRAAPHARPRHPAVTSRRRRARRGSRQSTLTHVSPTRGGWGSDASEGEAGPTGAAAPPLRPGRYARRTVASTFDHSERECLPVKHSRAVHAQPRSHQPWPASTLGREMMRTWLLPRPSRSPRQSASGGRSGREGFGVVRAHQGLQLPKDVPVTGHLPLPEVLRTAHVHAVRHLPQHLRAMHRLPTPRTCPQIAHLPGIGQPADRSVPGSPLRRSPDITSVCRDGPAKPATP
jgi:hypothetical protein